MLSVIRSVTGWKGRKYPPGRRKAAFVVNRREKDYSTRVSSSNLSSRYLSTEQMKKDKDERDIATVCVCLM